MAVEITSDINGGTRSTEDRRATIVQEYADPGQTIVVGSLPSRVNSYDPIRQAALLAERLWQVGYWASIYTRPLRNGPPRPGRGQLDDRLPTIFTSGDIINSDVVVDNYSELKQDMIPFYIRDTTNNKFLQFRCTVTGLTQTSNAEWNSENYVGRPYPVHFYRGSSRDLNFDFQLYAFSEYEVPNLWSKVNYLVGLTHPAQYVTNGNRKWMTPPYVELTIGNFLKDQPGFFRTVTVQVDQNATWETGKRMAGKGPYQSTPPQTQESEASFTDAGGLQSKVYNLPMMITVNCQYTIIEKNLRKTGDRLMGFEPTNERNPNVNIETPATDSGPLIDDGGAQPGDNDFSDDGQYIT